MSKNAPVLCLVDGFGFIFRAYHAIRPLTNSKGMSTHALFGYVNMLLKTRKQIAPDFLAVALEGRGPTFRDDIYPEYKANRPEAPKDLKEQIPWVEPITTAMGISVLRTDGLEADDLIAAYVKRGREAGLDVVVVSGDKDLMQLVEDPHVRLFEPMKERWFAEADVLEKYGVQPKYIRDYLALMGDSSDNVPGVPGIGAKGAAQLIGQFGGMESILERVEEIKANRARESLKSNRDMALLSLELVTLKADAELPVPVDQLRTGEQDNKKLVELFTDLGFSQFLRQLVPAAVTSQASPATKAEPSSTQSASKPNLWGSLPLGAAAARMNAASQPAGTDEEGRVGEETGSSGSSSAASALVVGDSAGMPAPVVVRTLQQLDQLMSRMVEVGVVALDTETTSLQAVRAKLVGVSMALGPTELYYIPVGHRGEGAASQLSVELLVERLRPVLADPALKVVGQNFKYDALVLGNYGIEVPGFCFDTMLASYLLDPGRQSHGLDALAAEFLGHRMTSYSEVTRQGGLTVRFDQVPVDQAALYSGEDAWATWLLMEKFEPELRSSGLMPLLEEVEIPVSKILTGMERLGVAVDSSALERLAKELAKGMIALEADIFKTAGGVFNINSPKQLGEVLFERLNLPKGKKTKTGYSTDVSVLEELAPLHPVPAAVLRYRSLSKLKGTYADVLPDLVNPETGRIHTSYNQAVAATGRLSSSDPNLQNIPIRGEDGKRIREAFVPAKGMVFLSADYSQIELRVLAHLTGDANLIDAFRRGDDIHARTAAELFRVLPTMVTPDQRRLAKTINFGILYGMSAFRLSREQGIPYKHAEKFINDYFARYPKIRQFMDQCVSQAVENGYVETLLKRRRYIPDVRSSNAQVRSAAERVAVNTPVQGGAADIIKLAMIRLNDSLRQTGSGARLIMQVHDELVLEVPRSEVESVSALVVKAMEEVMELSVPLTVGVQWGENWAEAHG